MMMMMENPQSFRKFRDLDGVTLVEENHHNITNILRRIRPFFTVLVYTAVQQLNCHLWQNTMQLIFA